MTIVVGPHNFEIIDQTGSAVVGASIIINDIANNQLVVPYTDNTASTYNSNLVTDSNGRATAWLPVGGYLATISSVALANPITEYFDVVPYLSLNTNTPNVTHVKVPGATYTIQNTDDVVLLDTSGGSFNVELPDAAQWSDEIHLVVTTSGNANTVALITTNNQTINNIASSGIYLGFSAVAKYISATLVSDQFDWWIV
jgi:hypothetical protein